MKKNPSNRGFIKWIILVVVGVMAVSYFNIDIKSEVEKPQTQQNLGYVKNLGSKVWKDYLSKPAHYLWNDVFVDLLWSAFKENFEEIKKGNTPTKFEPQNEEDAAKVDGLVEDAKKLEPKKIEPVE